MFLSMVLSDLFMVVMVGANVFVRGVQVMRAATKKRVL